MKTLKGHVILYDKDCPMCMIYTKALIQCGFLEKLGRVTYQELDRSKFPNLDMKKAVNEIALVNKETGDVSYGVQSLVTVIFHNVPAYKALLQNNLIKWLITRAYRFISYNRRVILPASETADFCFDPAFHKGYRIAYLLFSWCLTAIILSQYSKLLSQFVAASSWSREWVICGGQIIFQGSIAYFIQHKKVWDYLGNLMTVSLAGSALLGVGMLVFELLDITDSNLVLGYFLVVVGAMFLEHYRRSGLLQLTVFISLSWVIYRSIVLIFII